MISRLISLILFCSLISYAIISLMAGITLRMVEEFINHGTSQEFFIAFTIVFNVFGVLAYVSTKLIKNL